MTPKVDDGPTRTREDGADKVGTEDPGTSLQWRSHAGRDYGSTLQHGGGHRGRVRGRRNDRNKKKYYKW